MIDELHLFGFLDVLSRGTTIDIYAERFGYTTVTEILDTDPSGGGIVLTLDATVEEGVLELTEAMIASATYDDADECWELRWDGLIFRFGTVEGMPAFGPDGFFTEHPEALEEHGHAVKEREARREAKRAEQRGRTHPGPSDRLP